MEAALTRFLTAFENLDWEAFRDSFDDDVTAFFPTPEPPQRFVGRAAVEAQFRRVFGAVRAAAPGGPPFHRLVPEDLRVEPVGAGAVAATFHLRNDQRLARRTIVFTHTSHGWRIAHLHGSNVPVAPAAPATPLHSRTAPTPTPSVTQRPALIPWPTSAEMSPGDRVAITRDTVIEVTPGQPDLWRLATDLASLLRPALDTTIAIRDIAGPATAGTIRLEVVPATASLTGDGYDLAIGATGIRIAAATPAGIYYGTQTLRQLLPWAVELGGPRPFAVSVPAGRITDRPRYEWRGVFLDVSRHFFSVADVKRYIDLTSMYKMNRLHLHLSDDQGWRIEIASWPNLTRHGGSTAVGGGAGGFYTKGDYAEIVAYARARYMTVIPEIEMPSHCNAALASYPELTCDGVAPPLYTGIDVGFSNFCSEKEITFQFLDDVIREVAAMTPGPYIHIGGDEVKKMTPDQYSGFMARAQAIVARHGKTAIAWDEIIHGTMQPTTIVQYWRPDASLAPPPGTKLILSPANRLYLDMKYNDATVLGLNWAGNVDVNVPYEWDPAGHLKVPESSILGVETAIWSETPATIRDVEFLLFPRLPAVAELAWTAQGARDWGDFRVRLGAHAPRWSALGINAYWSPTIDWTR